LQALAHLSYPFIFRWNDDLYMIPESLDNRSVEVYRCEEFPYTWTFQGKLLDDICAVDATLLEHDGRWWMFVGVREVEGASVSDELCIFFADQPLSDTWTPHPGNPVVSDARRARPAGAILREGDRLLRPSQDCSRRYGYGLNISEILTLSPESYAEKPIQSRTPAEGESIVAIHTYTRSGPLAMMDGIHRTIRGRK
jgi:hypothetical protein